MGRAQNEKEEATLTEIDKTAAVAAVERLRARGPKIRKKQKTPVPAAGISAAPPARVPAQLAAPFFPSDEPHPADFDDRTIADTAAPAIFALPAPPSDHAATVAHATHATANMIHAAVAFVDAPRPPAATFPMLNANAADFDSDLHETERMETSPGLVTPVVIPQVASRSRGSSALRRVMLLAVAAVVGVTAVHVSVRYGGGLKTRIAMAAAPYRAPQLAAQPAAQPAQPAAQPALQAARPQPVAQPVVAAIAEPVAAATVEPTPAVAVQPVAAQAAVAVAKTDVAQPKQGAAAKQAPVAREPAPVAREPAPVAVAAPVREPPVAPKPAARPKSSALSEAAAIVADAPAPRASTGKKDSTAAAKELLEGL